MQPQFPQSFVENVEVPQTQFFDRVVVQLLHRDRYTTGAVLGLVGTPVVVQQQVLGFDRAENCGSSAVAVL